MDLAITLNTQAPPSQVLPGVTASAQPIEATCAVQASVTYDHGQFNVPDSDFRSQQLLPSREARWEWLVTPKSAGTHYLEFKVRPIILVSNTGQPIGDPLAGDRPFNSVISVKNAGGFNNDAKRATDSLITIKKLLAAIAAVIAAAFGVWAAVRKWRKPNGKEEQGNDNQAQPEPDQLPDEDQELHSG